MRNYVAALVLLCLCLTCHAQRTFVISVGISVYEDSTMNLNKPAADARLFAQTMQMHTPNILRISNRNATREKIIALIDTVCHTASEGDRIVFFFSGHGNNGFMYTHDRCYLRYDDIKVRMNASKASEKYCFVDACRSGSVAEAYTDSVNEASSSDGIVYIMSSRADELSWEGSKYDNGYFTQALIQALKGIADRDHDKMLTVDELFSYVYDGVVRMSRSMQHPQFIGPKDLMTTTPFLTWYE